MNYESGYVVLLFYKYVEIFDTEDLRQEQENLLKDCNMKGRILIALEGINGTCEGSIADAKKYIKALRGDSRFSDIQFKTSEGNGSCFPAVRVKIKPEIVATGWGSDIDPNTQRGEYIEPEELYKWFEEDRDDFVVVDMRNKHEVDGGKFPKTLHSGMTYFRELEETIGVFDELKYSGKKIVAVCNGGVRCEKASAFMKQIGHKNVYHLKEGIHAYMQKFPGKHYKGTMYTFDGRTTMQFASKAQRDVIGICDWCSESTENYYDCTHLLCPATFLVCKNCTRENLECKKDCIGILRKVKLTTQN